MGKVLAPFALLFAASCLGQYFPSNRTIQLGINIDPWNKQYGNPSASDITHLNASWVRFEFIDGSTGDSVSTFPFFDPIVDNLVRSGVHILMILDYTSFPGKPAHNAPTSAWDSYIPKYLNRVEQVATHYGDKIGAYEVWNEEDLANPTPSYDPTVPPWIYARILTGAYNAITNASKNPRVVMGGLASGNPGYVKTVIESSPDNTLHAHGVGLHPYGQRPFPNWPNPTWGFGVLTELVKRYYEVSPTQVWITEVGTTDLSVQGQFPMYTFEAVDEVIPTICPYVFWFCWSDGMVNPFGVVDKNGNPKKSYYSYAKFGGLPLVA